MFVLIVTVLDSPEDTEVLCVSENLETVKFSADEYVLDTFSDGNHNFMTLSWDTDYKGNLVADIEVEGSHIYFDIEEVTVR
jgi:hypothetical protein